MNKISTFYRNFIVDIILAVLALGLGILMLPPFGIGQTMVDILLAITLVAYLVLYLFDKLRHSKGTTFLLSFIEFVLIALLVLGLILEQFDIFNIGGVCRTVGLVMWLHGSFSVIILYTTLANVRSGKYNLPKFLIWLLALSVGVFLFANPIFSDLIINWAICIVLFIATVIFAALAILFAPNKKPQNSTK